MNKIEIAIADLRAAANSLEKIPQVLRQSEKGIFDLSNITSTTLRGKADRLEEVLQELQGGMHEEVRE